VADDWTKPVTRAEMAQLFVKDIMENIYGSWAVKFTLKGMVESTGLVFFTDTDDYYADRLAYWGIVPGGKFNPEGTLTYDEMTSLILKLMAYDNHDKGGSPLSKADIAEFGIGGDKGPNAKCTKEQAKMLCDKVILWRHEQNRVTGAKNEKTPGMAVLSLCVMEYILSSPCLVKNQISHIFLSMQRVRLN
jgi:hypothetical protein